jgi:S1-C subfamily serine protease
VAACRGKAPAPAPPEVAPPEAAPPAASGVPADFVALARALDPSVVSVRTSALVRGRESALAPWLGGQPLEAEIALGSGFVVDRRGLVVTNDHVIAGGTDISVKLASGDERPARVVGRDSELDIALLAVGGGDLVPARLGDSDAAQVGQWIVAIGNPFGLEHTVTAGILSAVERSAAEVPLGDRPSPYRNYLQTDASINPGNSGGPLVNLGGEVIGVAVAVDARGGGIGFAVPINMVKAILPALERDGRATRSFLGVFLSPMSDELARAVGLPAARGVFVSGVVEGSPAAQAGLAKGDVLLELDGQPARVQSVPWRTALGGPGTHMRATVWRGGQELSLEVVLGKAPR